MNSEEQKKLEILCNTIAWVIEGYFEQNFFKKLFNKFFYAHSGMASHIRDSILKISYFEPNRYTLEEARSELVRLLDYYRYYLATHVVSRRLRFLVQDAILITLNYSEKLIEVYQRYQVEQRVENIPTYIGALKLDEELNAYKKHYRASRSVFGFLTEKIDEIDLTIAAKAALINGKLVEFWGVEKLMTINLMRIKSELQRLARQHCFLNYLDKEHIESFASKITTILNYLKYPSVDFPLDALLQQSRYLLENIINAGGLDEQGRPQHYQHEVLIQSCYWVDEVFKAARGKVEFFQVAQEL